MTDGTIIAFGRFRLHRRERALFADAMKVELGARALDVLLALVDAKGAVVSKDALLGQVWPGMVMDDNNLQVQIFALRRALGPDRNLIRTVSRRGYQFAGPIAWAPTAPELAPPESAPAMAADPQDERPAALGSPLPVGELIGREEDLRQVIELQAEYRLLTLTGPGGIGKTSLALSAAWRLAREYPAGIHLVDLAAISEPDLVLPAVAAALDLRRLQVPLRAESVAAGLGARRVLLVLDNCEHLIDTVAAVAEALLRGAPRAQILATSREPLRAEGEWVYQVPPLVVPTPEATSADDLVRHSAVRLFLARARQAGGLPPVDDALADMIAAICRRLDGMPLAIELAAARAVVLGVPGVAAALDDRFRLLAGGRRTALPRHRTLGAALDWSFDLLGPEERALFCWLGVFAANFTLDAAVAVGTGAVAESDVADAIAGLVAKSLVMSETVGRGVRFRLLETMRAYALERLDADAAREARRRHLRHYAELMRRAEAAWQEMPTADWLTTYGGEIENVRAALHWSLGGSETDADDLAVGAALAADSMPLWLEASLHPECQQWAGRALAVRGIQDTPRERLLQVARGTALLSTGGEGAEVEAALQRGLALAEAQGSTEYALRALYSLWVYFLHENDYGAALRYARRFRAAAERQEEAGDLVIGDRMVGVTQHYLGQQGEARVSLERVLRAMPSGAQLIRESRFGLDQRVAALTAMARVLAVQGEAERALATAREAVEAARTLDRIASVCHALGELCVVALWTGNDAELAEPAAVLMADTQRHGMRFWRAHALVTRGVLAARAADAATAAEAFDLFTEDFGPDQVDPLYPSLTSAMVEGLTMIGRGDQALALVDRALGRSWAMQRWYVAELLVVRGELLLSLGEAESVTRAAADFVQAWEHARRQPALLFELRAAIGMARLDRAAGRDGDGLALLRAVYARFTEGFETRHLRDARALLTGG